MWIRICTIFVALLLLFCAWPGPVKAQNVTIPDANLRAKIQQTLGRSASSTTPITRTQLAGITQLLLTNSSNISSITGLEHATGLTRLVLQDNNITNIDSLYTLTNLWNLDLGRNRITNIGVLSKLTSLTNLHLNNNTITVIDSLYTLTNLRVLQLNHNTITNIDSLKNLTNLRGLLLNNNTITDLSPLRNLPSLEYMNLGSNGLTNTSISPLMHLTSLNNYLWLHSNNITNIDSLSTLTGLRNLNLRFNGGLSDLSPISGLTNLTHLDIFWANVSDISVVSNFTQLTNIDIRLNYVTDISALSNLTNLEIIRISTNSITDLSPLVQNTGVNTGDIIRAHANPLSAESRNTHVPALRAKVGSTGDVKIWPEATLVLSSSLIGENGATTTITATLDQPQGTLATTITVATTAGANAVAGDFMLSSNPVLIIAATGTTSTGTVTITTVDNAVASADKTVTISAASTVSFSSGGKIYPFVTPPLAVPLTIRDDEDPVATLALSPSEIDESGATNQTTVTATLNRPSSAAITITVSATAGANAVSGDFTLSSNPVLTIAVNSTTSTGTVTITAVDNAVISADKTVTVSGNAQSSAGVTSPSDVTLTIRDDGEPEPVMTEPEVENTVPDFTDAVDFQRYQQGTPITPLIFPDAQSGDGELTYTLGPPPPLPAGLTYTPPSDEDAHGGVLSGTPTEVQAQTTYTLTVTDEDGDVASVSFYIVIIADRMPSFSDTVAAQSYTQNREIEAITLPQATGGDGALTYALTPDLPEGLTFNTETRVLSGTPTEALDETTYTWTASDGDGDEATLVFALAISEDLMPSFADTVIAHRYLVKTDVEITLPVATGGDGVLAYILLPYLPEELSFDHEMRVLSGTLLQAIRETEYTLSALDADGDVASLVFTLEGLTPDFDGNGFVNFADFALFVVNYGMRRGEESYNSRYDLTSDGVVDYDDFLIFSQHYDTEI